MSIKDDYNAAKALAKAGKYQQAIDILKPYKSNKQIAALINQLESRLPTKKRPAWQWIVGVVAIPIIIIAALYIGINWNWWFGDEQAYYDKLFSAIEVCVYVEVYTEIESCNYEEMLEIYGAEVDYCYSLHGEIPTGIKSATEQWIQCLLDNDVAFIILND